jgi:hypothetical protein
MQKIQEESLAISLHTMDKNEKRVSRKPTRVGTKQQEK